MKEAIELRVQEKFAALLFDRREGERLGASVRKVLLAPDDPRWPEIKKLQKKLAGR